MHCTVRVLGPSDATQLRALGELFATAFDERAAPRGALPTEDHLRSLLAGDAFVALVALRDHELVGGLTGYFLP